jgi:hypothetical protein
MRNSETDNVESNIFLFSHFLESTHFLCLQKTYEVMLAQFANIISGTEIQSIKSDTIIEANLFYDQSFNKRNPPLDSLHNIFAICDAEIKSKDLTYQEGVELLDGFFKKLDGSDPFTDYHQFLVEDICSDEPLTFREWMYQIVPDGTSKTYTRNFRWVIF